jgi:hypothetical protein
MRVRSALVSMVAVGLLLAATACGGSSSSGGSSGTSTPSPPTSTSGGSSSTGSLGGGSDFCAKGKQDVEELQSKLAALASMGATPAHLKAEMNTLMTAYANAQSEAPDAIKSDLGVITDFLGRLNAVFKAHNYDEVASAAQMEALLTGTDAAKLKNAANHLQAWAAANCGA